MNYPVGLTDSQLCYVDGGHVWSDGGNGAVCNRCGKMLTCACGQFIRADGFDTHFPKCPVYKNMPDEVPE